MAKNGCRAIRIAIAAIFLLAPAALFAGDTVAFGHSVSLRGFSSPLFQDAEYAELALSAEFFPGKPLAPELSARWLVPANPFSPDDSLLGLGVDFTLFRLARHPFEWMSPRRTALAPSLGAAVYFPAADLADYRFALTAAPLRLFAGYGCFTVGSISLILDSSLARRGWGLGLLEFSYRIF